MTSKKASTSASSPSDVAETPAGPITLTRVILREVHYEELETSTVPSPLPPGQRMAVSTDVGAQLRIFADGMEMFVHAEIAPDPKYQPFVIRASISGLFGRNSQTSDEELLEFGTHAGIRILFPYIREIVSNVSSRGAFGPLWIDPINMTVSGTPEKVTPHRAKQLRRQKKTKK